MCWIWMCVLCNVLDLNAWYACLVHYAMSCIHLLGSMLLILLASVPEPGRWRMCISRRRWRMCMSARWIMPDRRHGADDSADVIIQMIRMTRWPMTQCFAVCCSLLQCVVVCYNDSDDVIIRIIPMTYHTWFQWWFRRFGWSFTTHFNTLHPTATHCNTLHHTATRCNTLQHNAAQCIMSLFKTTRMMCNIPMTIVYIRFRSQ